MKDLLLEIGWKRAFRLCEQPGKPAEPAETVEETLMDIPGHGHTAPLVLLITSWLSGKMDLEPWAEKSLALIKMASLPKPGSVLPLSVDISQLSTIEVDGWSM